MTNTLSRAHVKSSTQEATENLSSLVQEMDQGKETLEIKNITSPLPATARYIIPDLPTTDELLPFLRQMDQNKWYSNFGPLNNAFENEFIALVSKAQNEKENDLFATTLTSCYHALAIGLKLLGVGPDDAVLVPSITFPACPLAVHHIGAKVVLADVDYNTGTLTPAIARAIAQKHIIKAVMPVAVYGVPLPVKEWDEFTEDTGIAVIIDGAAAIESQRYLKKGFVAHSLHALKPFGIGEGGFLVGRNPDLINKARQYSNFGTIDRITYMDGENAKLSEYHAAVGLAQMKRWPEIKKRRAALFGLYKKTLGKAALGLDLFQDLHKAVVSSLMVRIETENASKLMEALRAKGTFAHRTYFPPLYHHPHFASLAVANAKGEKVISSHLSTKVAHMPQSEALNGRLLGLPFHAFLTQDEIEKDVQNLGDVLSRPK